MPRLLLPLILIIVTVGFAQWMGRPRAAEVAVPVVDATKKEVSSLVGVSGCAAAACHGNGERGRPGGEYSTWIAVDPHAKAYNALFKPESVRMHKALTGQDEGAHRNPLCLQCHAMGHSAPEAMQSDGVGCERCHGNASEWKSTHYLRDFDRKQGFVDLRQMPIRVEACMKCHVGDGSMEVDHDLIAAGHPRLRFEYAAYSANYPRHWALTSLNKRDDDEVRGWLLGQIVSARAASELLAHRAVSKPDSWPEFAEFDCASCHHGLTPRNFRTDRDLKLAEANPKVKIPLGRMLWGTWYNPLLSTLAEATKADHEKLDASQKRLGKLMQKTSPNKVSVSREARDLASALRNWEQKIANHHFDSVEMRGLMKALAARPELVRKGWDGGTQVYLGLAALNYNLPDKRATPFLAPLQRMRKGLAEAYPGVGARPRYDVPSDYHPAPLEASLKSILEQLESSHAPRD